MILFSRGIRLLVLTLFLVSGSLSRVSAENASLSGKSLYPVKNKQRTFQSDKLSEEAISISGLDMFRSTSYGDGFGDEELGVITPIGDTMLYFILLSTCYAGYRRIKIIRRETNNYK